MRVDFALFFVWNKIDKKLNLDGEENALRVGVSESE